MDGQTEGGTNGRAGGRTDGRIKLFQWVQYSIVRAIDFYTFVYDSYKHKSVSLLTSISRSCYYDIWDRGKRNGVIYQRKCHCIGDKVSSFIEMNYRVTSAPFIPLKCSMTNADFIYHAHKHNFFSSCIDSLNGKNVLKPTHDSTLPKYNNNNKSWVKNFLFSRFRRWKLKWILVGGLCLSTIVIKVLFDDIKHVLFTIYDICNDAYSSLRRLLWTRKTKR